MDTRAVAEVDALCSGQTRNNFVYHTLYEVIRSLPALWAGLNDTVAVFREELAALGSAAPPADALERLLGDLAETLDREPVGATAGHVLIAAVCGVQIPAIERALAERVAAVSYNFV